MSAGAVEIESVSHWYGAGALRRQILFDVSASLRTGEIVILSGPSGSGKTTLLTLIGALRSAQTGSLRVLGHELCRASERVLTEVRRQIGYVFQMHNLLEALTVRQNVQLGLQPDRRKGSAKRAEELLASVGLAAYGNHQPSELSGGQRQRVAIARALIGGPRLVLADEPTASLDRETGRQIVTLIRGLAREHGVTVLLVTHDHRILDVADRILSLEDGHISSFMSAVTKDTRRMWGLLARDLRQGELVRRVREIPADRFAGLLEEMTRQTRELLEMVEVAQGETFDSALAQVLEAFALKAAEGIGAERARAYFLDSERKELFAFDTSDNGAPTPDEVTAALEQASSQHRGHVLALPLLDHDKQVFAVIELARSESSVPFVAADQDHVERLASSLSVILQTWFRMSCTGRGAGLGVGSSYFTAEDASERGD